MTKTKLASYGMRPLNLAFGSAYILAAVNPQPVNHDLISLKNHEVDPNEMFDMGIETMNMPMSEKLKFEQGDDGASFGYVLLSSSIIAQSDTKRMHA